MKFRKMVTTAPPLTDSGGAVVSLYQPPTRPREEDEQFALSPVRNWRPNQEPDTPLKCGCSIPWPVTVLLGSGGKVHCDLHGWQNVTQKEKQRARKASKKWESTAQAILEDPPPF